MKRLGINFCLFAACMGLWVGALSTRRAVYHQQTRSLDGQEAPFLMESALQFRMTRMVMETGTLPEHDPKVGVPEGVDPRTTYSLGAEWVYSFFASFFPEEMTFTSRVRWVSAGLFSLAVPFMFLWIFFKTGSWWGGLVAGLLVMVSPAFAVRSSGLELSRENLAIPLFVLFFALQALTRQQTSGRSRWGIAVASAVSLALAQCFWDLTQYVTGLWAVGEVIRSLRSGDHDSGRESWISVTACLGVVSLLNPYLREHGFLFSPVLALLCARLPLLFVGNRIPGMGKRILVLAALAATWMLLGRLFYQNYSHFSELLIAKIRFGNVKPVDAALLTPIQRIMWTPALNSSTSALTKAYFPISLFIGCVAVAALLLGRSGKHRTERTSGNPEVFYTLFTLPVYVLFFRFHVFLILFLAACIGILISRIALCSRKWIGILIPLGLTLLLPGVEIYHLLFFEPDSSESKKAEQYAMRQLLEQAGITSPMHTLADNRWASAHKLRYPQVQELIQALTTRLREADPLAHPEINEPVLAGFGLSGTILTYADMPIVLHPKFETPGIREKVLQFYEHLYLKSEKEFRDWALSQDARYFVHRKGSFTQGDLRNSPPYMVNALPPPEDSAWHLLEHSPENAEWFFPVPLSHPVYSIYRIVSDEDIEMAERFTLLGLQNAQAGDLESAEKWAMRALTYHWKHKPAQYLLANVRNAKRRSP